MAVVLERNQDATVYCGNVDDKVLEPLLWELFLQAGPVVNVHMPKDRITQNHQGYGFIEFMSEEDADYAIKILNMIKVYGKPIRVNKASAHNKNLDVGANIFIGNLDPDIDEKLLYDTFSAFGVILTTPKIMRDPETGNSKGFAFINFASFEASDAAIDAMNGQYLSNRPISVSYSFKKDTKGERHGSAAERLLAASNPLTQSDRPHQLFADAPPMLPPILPDMMSSRSIMPPTIIPPPMGGPMGMPPSMMGGDSMGMSFLPAFMQGPPPMQGMPPNMAAMGFPNMPPPGFMHMAPPNAQTLSTSSANSTSQVFPPMPQSMNTVSSMSTSMRMPPRPPVMFGLPNERPPWMMGPPRNMIGMPGVRPQVMGFDPRILTPRPPMPPRVPTPR
ncbi:splicing factor 3B subunit 4-like [Hydra vulgaris]|uniref:Splicing factor 3B subunit 4-like n=1 Tax=Hydra vulgaris TaxID=6087 RepID=A0ABM4BVI4_HYDVU